MEEASRGHCNQFDNSGDAEAASAFLHEYFKCLIVKQSSPNISLARGLHSICFLW